MKRKIIPGIIVIITLIFAGIAYSDFGSFSGNSDYSTSERSSSSGGSPAPRQPRTYTGGSTSTRSYSGGNVNVIPRTGGFSTRSGFMDDDTEDESFDEIAGVVFVLVVFFIFWFIISRRKKHHNGEPIALNVDQSVRTLNPMSSYLEFDPEFDEERIKTLMGNLYVQMQDTWHAKDISPLRPYMTDSFFSQMDRQLDAFRKTGRTDYTERIAVLSVSLKGWRQSAGMDYLTVGLNSRIVSYVLDDRTGKLLSGDMNREKFMEYEIELCRKSGATTSPATEGTHSATCPHCGAPLKLNASAQCEYCGSVIEAVNTDWAICGMRGISQRTV